ncbi:ureidoglycolate hydrolase [Xylaria flabelliformis]|nr:ureidoglycolate hydrolase [Xylaria flabelliformis]
MLVRTTHLTEPLTITAAPLTRDAFAPFGDVIANPRPESRPSNTAPDAIARGELPCGAVSANQGTAIQYRAIASMRNLYDSAPSGKAGSPRMTMFVCGARTLLVSRDDGDGGGEKEKEVVADGVQIKVLERHPFTSQTFVPLTADGTKRYLVVVAPTLAPMGEDEDLPAPRDAGLPGRGLPDVSRLVAFVATGEQAVTYAAGTWHAPMIALGPPDSMVDFVVVQFANDVPVEDCQEVALEDGGKGDDGPASRIWVRVPEGDGRALAKL